MTDRSQNLITPVLLAGCFIIIVSFSIRASFGVFQIPIATEFNWLRAEFSLAIAIQNLAWGIGQPLFAAFAEKFGDRRALILGAVLYGLGLVLSAYSITPLGHQLYNILIGFGIAGTGFGVLLAVVGRAASDENRSMALGIVTAAGSIGQIFGPPIAEYLLTQMNWSAVFLVFAASLLTIFLTLPFFSAAPMAPKSELEDSLKTILGKAMRDPTYTLIFLGFFSCGFQLGFITAHFPAFVTEMCGPIAPDGYLAKMGFTSTSALGALAIAVIGATNIAGTLIAGALGKTYTKKYLLFWIYVGRTIAGTIFILNPITPMSVLIFSAVMGSFWLATVPLTAGLVAYIYGLRYMGTLYGIVFLSHQIGGFLGVWLGGKLYDIYGDYSLVWWVGIAVGAFSAIIHLPVREQPLHERAIA